MKTKTVIIDIGIVQSPYWAETLAIIDRCPWTQRLMFTDTKGEPPKGWKSTDHTYRPGLGEVTYIFSDIAHVLDARAVRSTGNVMIKKVLFFPQSIDDYANMYTKVMTWHNDRNISTRKLPRIKEDRLVFHYLTSSVWSEPEIYFEISSSAVNYSMELLAEILGATPLKKETILTQDEVQVLQSDEKMVKTRSRKPKKEPEQ